MRLSGSLAAPATAVTAWLALAGIQPADANEMHDFWIDDVYLVVLE